MVYTDHYEAVLNTAREKINRAAADKACPVFAFTSNLDIVLHWDPEIYCRILEQYLIEQPHSEPGDLIESMYDFARITAGYVCQGRGGNFDITNSHVCEYLRTAFRSELSLGGTCAQGAAALGSVGFPVSVHLTDCSHEVCSMLNHKGTTAIKEGRLVPVAELETDDPPVSHFILQFNAGDRIRVLGREVEIPVSNRLILFYDTMQKKVPIDEGFFQYWEREHKEIRPSSFLVSGFDAIIDEDVMTAHLDRLEEFLDRFGKNHPYAVRYLEGAYYMNPAVKRMVFSRLSPYMDMIGMNEEELEEQVRRIGGTADISTPEGVIHALDMVLSVFKSGGVVLHTKDYSLYYGKEVRQKIEDGLTMGNLMSATRARIGIYGTLDELRETLKLPLSRRGVDFCEKSECTERKGQLVVVPSRYLEHPKYTIGLGDTFVSGVHTCFL